MERIAAANKITQSGSARVVIRETYGCKASRRIISSLVRGVRLRGVLWATMSRGRWWCSIVSSRSAVIIALSILHWVLDIGQVLLLHPCPSSLNAHHGKDTKDDCKNDWTVAS